MNESVRMLNDIDRIKHEKMRQKELAGDDENSPRDLTEVG